MAEKPRPLRADAVRNRAVLDVAYETFAEEGMSVPIDEIARRAGVGAGTVYRHFPTKEALFAAIASNRLQHLIDRAAAFTETKEPGEAFFAYLAMLVEEGKSDQGLADALRRHRYRHRHSHARRRTALHGAARRPPLPGPAGGCCPIRHRRQRSQGTASSVARPGSAAGASDEPATAQRALAVIRDGLTPRPPLAPEPG